MKEFRYVIKDENGIHARPAGILVKQAAQYESDITVKCGDRSASAKKLFGLMAMGIKKGSEITVTVNGSDEDKAAEDIEKFIRSNF
ncbi:MAG: HPr family phosphocarrier protein [Huintestinicola sp.]